MANARTRRYEKARPLCCATETMATSGAVAHGVLTRPKISPISNAPKSLNGKNRLATFCLSISPKNPSAYATTINVAIEADKYAQKGAILSITPIFATSNNKIEKLITNPNTNKSEYWMINRFLFCGSMPELNASALLTSKGKVTIEQGAIDVKIPTINDAIIAKVVCVSIAWIKKSSIIDPMPLLLSEAVPFLFHYKLLQKPQTLFRLGLRSPHESF